MVNTRIAILMTASLGVCLGGVPRYRRRNTGGEVPLRNEPRFVEDDRRIHDQFIYGHDDEPDYNDDVSGSHFNNDYHSRFSSEFSSYNGEEQFNYQPSQQEEEAQNLNDESDFLNSFITNNMNSFAAEKHQQQQHQQQSQLTTSNKNQGSSPNSETSQNVETPAGAEDQSEPSLREFTLLVSKLLFHLSQM